MKTVKGRITIDELPPGEWRMLTYGKRVLLTCPDQPLYEVVDQRLKQVPGMTFYKMVEIDQQRFFFVSEEGLEMRGNDG